MSLREEQCNKVCRILDDVLANRPTERDSLIVAVREAFKALAEPHWIPVEQALPEEPFGCLVTVWDEEPMTGEMFENLLPYFVGWDGEQWNDGDGQQCPFEVIAWMPLPEPYRGEEK